MTHTKQKAGISLRRQIIDMEVGDTVPFPLDRYDYVVSCRQRIATNLGRTITSSTDKVAGVVRLTRTA